MGVFVVRPIDAQESPLVPLTRAAKGKRKSVAGTDEDIDLVIAIDAAGTVAPVLRLKDIDHATARERWVLEEAAHWKPPGKPEKRWLTLYFP